MGFFLTLRRRPVAESGNDTMNPTSSHNARNLPSGGLGRGCDDSEGGEQFDWSALVPQIVHPLKVAIIEALLWVDQPLSATDLRKLCDDEFSTSVFSYHLPTLVEAGALKMVRKRKVRGTTEKFYFFPTQAPATRPRSS